MEYLKTVLILKKLKYPEVNGKLKMDVILDHYLLIQDVLKLLMWINIKYNKEEGIIPSSLY